MNKYKLKFKIKGNFLSTNYTLYVKKHGDKKWEYVAQFAYRYYAENYRQECFYRDIDLVNGVLIDHKEKSLT